MKTALYVVEDEGSFQIRYRVRNVVEALEGSTRWRGEYVLRKRVNSLDLTGYDLVVIERQTDKNGWSCEMIRRAHESGVEVLFDLDDLVFDYHDLGLTAGSVREKTAFYWMGYFWGIRRIARQVDGFLCTNEFLGKKLKRSFGKPYKVISNSLNREQVEVSDKCLGKKKHGGFVIGYFSGSPTHTKDFRLVEKDLVRFLEFHDDARLRIVGDMELSGRMQEKIAEGRVDFLEKVDYLKLQKLMSEVDVNIAPLVLNDFTNCKSELKFFEAAAVETTTIASPSYTFSRAIADGKNGFLAQPGEWYDKLEYLYRHPEENRKIAKRAREYTLKHYYGKEFLKEVERAYDYFRKEEK